MGEPKPLASLSSTLLARKGQAKPAMRPQGFGGFSSQFNGQDDLGWNDMGHDVPASVAPIHQSIQPAPAGVTPLVVRQRAELEEEFSPLVEDILPEPVAVEAPVLEPVFDDEPEADEEPAIEAVSLPAVQAPKKVAVKGPIPTVAVTRARKAAKERKAKAAFTLRLDPERHLRLRLACAVSRESAQTIVTEALDMFLETLPEIDALARKLPGSAH